MLPSLNPNQQNEGEINIRFTGNDMQLTVKGNPNPSQLATAALSIQGMFFNKLNQLQQEQAMMAQVGQVLAKEHHPS